MFFLLVSRRKEREPRGVRPAVPAPVRPRGGAGGDLLHPGPVPSAAPARPRPPGDRRAEDRGADAGGGLRGRRRIGVPRGPRRHPRGYSRGGGGGRKADPLAGDRPGNDARTARGRGPGRGGDGGRIGERRGPRRPVRAFSLLPGNGTLPPPPAGLRGTGPPPARGGSSLRILRPGREVY